MSLQLGEIVAALGGELLGDAQLAIAAIGEVPWDIQTLIQPFTS